jgi:excisionase family DNA binding protein
MMNYIRPKPQLIGTAEAARMLGVDARSVQKLVHRGKFPGTMRPLEKKFVIPRAAVEAYRTQCTLPNKPL